MVSAFSLAAMFFTLLLSLFLPVGLLVYGYRRYRFSLKAFFVGAAVFILFQVASRIPLLVYLSSQPCYINLSANIFFTALVIGGFTAALFEECGRYLGFILILKNDLSWKNGLAYGLGHGGAEAILIVGLTYINNLVISLMINSGTFEQYMAPLMSADAAAALKWQLITMPPSIFACAGVERALTLMIQIALSLIVLYAVKHRQPLYLLLAILLHTLLNAGAILLQDAGIHYWLIELYIAVFAAAALLLVVRSRPLIDRPARSETAGGDGVC